MENPPQIHQLTKQFEGLPTDTKGKPERTVPKSGEIIKETTEEIIQKAEKLELVWRPLFERVKRKATTAKEISQRLDLPHPEGKLETQVKNMRTAINMAFLTKERENHPQRNILETLHSGKQHPQEFVNLLVTGEGMYFDQEGKPANLEEYLTNYYQPLIEKGVSIKIVNTPAGEAKAKELAYVDDRQTQLKYQEAATTVDQLIEKRIEIPILEIRNEEKTKRIPILFSDKYLEETGVYAEYSWNDRGPETINDTIFVNGTRPLKAHREKSKSIPEVASGISHEVDHAIFNFLHDSKYKQSSKEAEEIDRKVAILKKEFADAQSLEQMEEADTQLKILQERKSQLEEKSLYLKFINEVGSSIVFEGLARKAQRVFLEAQGKGLVEFSPVKEALIEAVNLITDNSRLEDQLHLQMCLYGIGEVLTSVAAPEKGMQELYGSDVLDKEIVSRPKVIRDLIGHLGKSRNEAVEALNELRETPIESFSPSTLKLLIRKGLEPYSMPFLLGVEYFDLIRKIDEEVNQLSPEEVDRRINELRNRRPDVAEKIAKSYGENKKEALKCLEFGIGQLKQRFNEEFDKVIPS